MHFEHRCGEKGAPLFVNENTYSVNVDPKGDHKGAGGGKNVFFFFARRYTRCGGERRGNILECDQFFFFFFHTCELKTLFNIIGCSVT